MESQNKSQPVSEHDEIYSLLTSRKSEILARKEDMEEHIKSIKNDISKLNDCLDLLDSGLDGQVKGISKVR